MRDRVGGGSAELAPEESLALAGVSWNWMQRSIHDLCQPLTALQVLLYLGLADGMGDTGGAGKEAALRKTLEDAMVECGKLVLLVRSMQQWVADHEENGSLD